MKMKSFLLIMLLLPIQALADFATALEAYERQDFPSAIAEFRVLANENDADAQYMLGYLHAVGDGLLQDYVKAHKWFNLAAMQGNQGARTARNKIESRMTPQQIAKAQRQARKWRPRAEEYETPTQPRVPPLPDNPSPDKATVKRIQRQLNNLGYDAGPADGVPGQRTYRAIRAYQRQKGMYADGKITQTLADSLATEQRQFGRQKQQVRFPSVWERRTGKKTASVQSLIKDLRKIIDKAEKKRAADRWLMRDLRKLVASSTRPWTVELLHEQFSARGYRLNPALRLHAGSTELRQGSGLLCKASSKNIDKKFFREELPLRIIGSVLGLETSRSPGPSFQTTEISIRHPVSNSFALKVNISSLGRDARLRISLFRKKKTKPGYSLELIPGRKGGVDLIRHKRSEQVRIASSGHPLGINDGQDHVVEWLRGKDGEIVVAIDGKELIRVIDKGITKPFDRLVLSNSNGDYLLQEVLLKGTSASL